MRRPLPLLLLLLSHCAAEQPAGQPFHHTLMLTALQVDPTSAFGGYLKKTLVGLPAFNIALSQLTCGGLLPLAVELKGTRKGANGRGEMHLHLVIDEDGNKANNCEAGARFLLDPRRLGPAGRSPARGPLWFEGPSIEARVDPAATLGVLGLIFEDWIKVSGLLRAEGTAVDFGRIVAVWSAGTLRRVPIYDARLQLTGLTWLDNWAINAGMQPDVDRDSDGLERFEDTDKDGRIDQCVDGDGTLIKGVDCHTADEIVDGFSLTLLFRVEPCELVDYSNRWGPLPDLGVQATVESDPVANGQVLPASDAIAPITDGGTASLEAGAEPIPSPSNGS